MAAWLSKLFGRIKNRSIIVTGLDGSGKTSIRYKLLLGKFAMNIPTIGFGVESFEYNDICFSLWEVKEKDKTKPLWKDYYTYSDGIIFVIDSTNTKDQLVQAKNLLNQILKFKELEGIPLLIYINKYDLLQDKNVADITNQLGLNQIKGREWYCQSSCAINGDGLYEGLDWLSSKIN
ncbi:hypothetical protein ENUP19_0085G0134 [Entamoeba nuttalli]|uniref:ADP-ribosylation factor, putative n=2 Tax=Entamoeba nuttalli TaxID=412467 RepID=K2HEQ2_ENTNP|nr:ADP-ribosylation factor, putative [Entamoeba nuttalli P19]EKE41229.1 ADP-ribosylation factor, putative [Entamoeba nuttalli P19]|eukprot:XP_008856435.1 ADP-ribosylation factor, putative [Entamoeba nuttalli P19]